MKKTFKHLFIHKFLYHTLNAKCAPKTSSLNFTEGEDEKESTALKNPRSHVRDSGKTLTSNLQSSSISFEKLPMFAFLPTV